MCRGAGPTGGGAFNVVHRQLSCGHGPDQAHGELGCVSDSGQA